MTTLHVNRFKQSLQSKQTLIGAWLATGEPYIAEMMGGIGYDWLLVDGEHAPNDLRSTLAQLQAIGSANATNLQSGKSTLAHPVVRIPHACPQLIKQYLELGAHNLLVPVVNTPEQAQRVAQAMRYPPQGHRGIGSGLARSSRWGTFAKYLHEANEQVCLLVQVESAEAIQHIDAIANTDGVDGVFIGPADLCASMGYLGQTEHPEVEKQIEFALKRIHAAGKSSGILATKEDQAKKWINAGVSFAAVGVDITMLAKAAQENLQKYR